MLISLTSAVFIVILLVFQVDAHPVSVSGISGEIGSTGFGPVNDDEFPSQFYRLASVPDDKDEAVEEVLRLLKGNRVVESLPEESLSTKLQRLGDGSDYLAFPLPDETASNRPAEKRKLKFNPTGWRKKRSVDNVPAARDILEATARGHQRKEQAVGVRVPPATMALHRAQPKHRGVVRRSLHRNYVRLDDIIAHLRSLLAKRKGGPLDFNPTGW